MTRPAQPCLPCAGAWPIGGGDREERFGRPVQAARTRCPPPHKCKRRAREAGAPLQRSVAAGCQSAWPRASFEWCREYRK
ncbi:hypothetical protein C6P77_14645 [Burkholderia ambifaria]|nr:hypothetical protein C6P77_14645 [Burkholderia ambifaria]